MMRKRSFALAILAASFAIAAAPPLAAQSQSKTATQRAKEQPRTVIVPGYGTVYVLPQQPKDTRTPKQRCVDEQIEREGGSPSVLSMAAIDLKCSQR